MEFRTLTYFLEIAREGNMTRAAETLHVSQPTLSKAMKELEEELGKKLFLRHRVSVELTDEGMLLRKRAGEILEMVSKTEQEFQALDDITGGDIYIGCAESDLIRYLGDAIKAFQAQYPDFRFHLTSGDTSQVVERMDRGLIDLCFIVEPPDLSRYNYLEVPGTDVWGLIVPADSKLAEKEQITFEDLRTIPVMIKKARQFGRVFCFQGVAHVIHAGQVLRQCGDLQLRYLRADPIRERLPGSPGQDRINRRFDLFEAVDAQHREP